MNTSVPLHKPVRCLKIEQLPAVLRWDSSWVPTTSDSREALPCWFWRRWFQIAVSSAGVAVGRGCGLPSPGAVAFGPTRRHNRAIAHRCQSRDGMAPRLRPDWWRTPGPRRGRPSGNRSRPRSVGSFAFLRRELSAEPAKRVVGTWFREGLRGFWAMALGPQGNAATDRTILAVAGRWRFEWRWGTAGGVLFPLHPHSHPNRTSKRPSRSPQRPTIPAGYER
jgi:hypothetical protein